MTPTTDLARAVREGDRRALARAITLVESTRADHRADAVALLDAILPATGTATRVGISGRAGAGKSTFIEALGVHLVDAGHRVAVLAVDPSSPAAAGRSSATRPAWSSCRGDRKRSSARRRREERSVGRAAREALLVCEAAGFDVVLVETVGVGQSEVAVAGMVDLFVLLLGPGAGDELQGVKRGIVELADLLVVNKADGDLADAARHTAADYAHALHLVRSTDDRAMDRVRTCSALLGEGIDELWGVVGELVAAARASGELDAKRTSRRGRGCGRRSPTRCSTSSATIRR